MRKYFLIVSVLYTVGFASASLGSAKPEDRKLDGWLITTAKQAGIDPNDKRIPLDTSEQSRDFVLLTQKLYHSEITHSEFTGKINDVYPGHQYEIDFLIHRLPVH